MTQLRSAKPPAGRVARYMPWCPTGGRSPRLWVGVGALLFAECRHHVDEAPVVLDPPLRTARLLLLLLLLVDLKEEVGMKVGRIPAACLMMKSSVLIKTTAPQFIANYVCYFLYKLQVNMQWLSGLDSMGEKKAVSFPKCLHLYLFEPHLRGLSSDFPSSGQRSMDFTWAIIGDGRIRDTGLCRNCHWPHCGVKWEMQRNGVILKNSL